MKISLIHPSRNRPQQAAATAKAWLSSAKRPELIEYIFSIDIDDNDRYEYLNLFDKISEVIVGNNKSAIQAINGAAMQCRGDLIIAISDDFNTPPFHWDEALRKALEGKEDYVVKTQDGLQPWIMTLPIMDRVYYNRFGYVYNPAYIHMFCDCELAHVGELLGKTITLELMFRHSHYSTGATPKDTINEKNDKTWAQGEAVYLDRMMRFFDLPEDEIVNPINKLPEHHLNWLASKGITFEEKAVS